jgi:Cu+-exporting ATPase
LQPQSDLVKGNLQSSVPACFHCGEPCRDLIVAEEKSFCCEGCKQVYLILSQIDGCDISMMQQLKGVRPKGKYNQGQWDFLNEPEIQQQLLSFKSPTQAHIQFQLPNIHCSSCIWLLEHLGKINKGIIHSTVDFNRKEASLIYDPQQLSLSEVAALLDYIGYPPSISHGSSSPKKNAVSNQSTLLRIGIAGFCFSNIMMLSFPDYLSGTGLESSLLSKTFTGISLILSLPVIFYAATPFFIQAWKGLRQRFLNIDAPIALAISITYLRSLYEIYTASGTGYLDSMSGIVFFMLIGRWFQERSQKNLTFDRDYRSYFPMTALVLKDGLKKYTAIDQLQKDDLLLIRNQEIIPADVKLCSKTANIDYSFVTGEKEPVQITESEMIYAGGKQVGTAIEVQIIHPVSSSHLTRLWNNDAFHSDKNKDASFVHPWSRYFSLVLFSIAIGAGIYWQWQDPHNTWKAVTSVLIVACPCSLLLTATFTFGNLRQKLGAMGIFLKNANVIEKMAEGETLVFDKTGTLTGNKQSTLSYQGKALRYDEIIALTTIASQSHHPLSRSLSEWNQEHLSIEEFTISEFAEYPGKGIEATCQGMKIKIGKVDWVCESRWFIEALPEEGSSVSISIDGLYKGRFTLQQDYREGIFNMLRNVSKTKELHIISGDNPSSEQALRKELGKSVPMLFYMSPEDKLEYIQALQSTGKKVIMIGDGLNDAGALKKADAGIAVSDQSQYFTPACDAIIDGSSLKHFDTILATAASGKKIVVAGFALSIAYNIAGMYFATQALLSPMIAAILMPASTISIIALSYFGVALKGPSKT